MCGLWMPGVVSGGGTSVLEEAGQKGAGSRCIPVHKPIGPETTLFKNHATWSGGVHNIYIWPILYYCHMIICNVIQLQYYNIVIL